MCYQARWRGPERTVGAEARSGSAQRIRGGLAVPHPHDRADRREGNRDRPRDPSGEPEDETNRDEDEGT